MDMVEHYLFLGIDGVLNTGNYQKYLKENELESCDEYGPLFDPNAVDNLRQLISRTNYKIVISSSWRKMGIERLRRMWKDRGMPGSVHSVTPIINLYCQGGEKTDLISEPPRMQKTFEIYLWLKYFASKNPCCLVIDENEVFVANSYYVQVNTQIGLDFSFDWNFDSFCDYLMNQISYTKIDL